MSVNKKAKLEVTEILQLILAAGAIFVLTLLLIRIFLGGYNQNDETAKSYLEMLKTAVAAADKSNGIGEFEIWQPENEVHYMLVYFGEKHRYSNWYWGRTGFGVPFFFNFFTGNHGPNYICVCYGKSSDLGKSTCRACTSLNSPAYFGDFRELSLISLGAESIKTSVFGAPIVAYGQKLYIKKFDNSYFFDTKLSGLPERIDYSSFDEPGKGNPHPEFVCKEVQQDPSIQQNYQPITFRYTGAWEFAIGDKVTANTEWTTMARSSLTQAGQHKSFSELLMNRGFQGYLSSEGSQIANKIYAVRLDFDAGKKILLDSKSFECPGKNAESRAKEPVLGDLLDNLLALKVYLFQYSLDTTSKQNIKISAKSDLESVTKSLKDSDDDNGLDEGTVVVSDEGGVGEYIKKLFGNCKFEGLDKNLFFEIIPRDLEYEESKDYYEIQVVLGEIFYQSKGLVMDYWKVDQLDKSQSIFYLLLSKNPGFAEKWGDKTPDFIKFDEVTEGYEPSVAKKEICSGDFDLAIVQRGAKK
jgi:hypothetical protein